MEQQCFRFTAAREAGGLSFDQVSDFITSHMAMATQWKMKVTIIYICILSDSPVKVVCIFRNCN